MGKANSKIANAGDDPSPPDDAQPKENFVMRMVNKLRRQSNDDKKEEKDEQDEKKTDFRVAIPPIPSMDVDVESDSDSDSEAGSMQSAFEISEKPIDVTNLWSPFAASHLSLRAFTLEMSTVHRFVSDTLGDTIQKGVIYNLKQSAAVMKANDNGHRPSYRAAFVVFRDNVLAAEAFTQRVASLYNALLEYQKEIVSDRTTNISEIDELDTYFKESRVVIDLAIETLKTHKDLLKSHVRKYKKASAPETNHLKFITNLSNQLDSTHSKGIKAKLRPLDPKTGRYKRKNRYYEKFIESVGELKDLDDSSKHGKEALVQKLIGLFAPLDPSQAPYVISKLNEQLSAEGLKYEVSSTGSTAPQAAPVKAAGGGTRSVQELKELKDAFKELYDKFIDCKERVVPATKEKPLVFEMIRAHTNIDCNEHTLKAMQQKSMVHSFEGLRPRIDACDLLTNVQRTSLLSHLEGVIDAMRGDSATSVHNKLYQMSRAIDRIHPVKFGGTGAVGGAVGAASAARKAPIDLDLDLNGYMNIVCNVVVGVSMILALAIVHHKTSTLVSVPLLSYWCALIGIYSLLWIGLAGTAMTFARAQDRQFYYIGIHVLFAWIVAMTLYYAFKYIYWMRAVKTRNAQDLRIVARRFMIAGTLLTAIGCIALNYWVL